MEDVATVFLLLFPMVFNNEFGGSSAASQLLLRILFSSIFTIRVYYEE